MLAFVEAFDFGRSGFLLTLNIREEMSALRRKPDEP
jgi:hypothetical protein